LSAVGIAVLQGGEDVNELLTVTMNPAIDVSGATERVVDTEKLRCTGIQHHPGGGGINVARVLHRLGSNCTAYYPAGGARGRQLRELLDIEGVRSQVVEIAAETRESICIHEECSGHDFRFVLPGPRLTEAEWRNCLAELSALDPAPEHTIVSGSLPPGVPDDFYARLARVARHRGIRLTLDTSGPALAAALDVGVYLIKPSLREFLELTGLSTSSEAEWIAAARAIVNAGQSEIIVLSLGERGALLITRDETLRAERVAVKVESTVGAGDSLLAGLVWGLDQNAGLEHAFRCGMAAAAAALLTRGTALCQAADVERLLERVTIVSV
jgi:6-phosphofructokinase 2